LGWIGKYPDVNSVGMIGPLGSLAASDPQKSQSDPVSKSAAINECFID